MRSLTTSLLATVALAVPVIAQEGTGVSLGVHDGVTVIHRQIPGSRIVSAQVFLLGGPAVTGAERAGIEAAADMARLIETAVATGFAENRLRPMEFGGDMGTTAVTQAVVTQIKGE